MTFACSAFLSTGIRWFRQMPLRNFYSITRPAIQPLEIGINGVPSLLAAVKSELLPSVSPLLTQVAGFKVKARIRRRCKDCLYVVRHQRHYIVCPTHGRHKQMSLKKKDYKTWILTHATQSKVRPY